MNQRWQEREPVKASRYFHNILTVFTHVEYEYIFWNLCSRLNVGFLFRVFWHSQNWMLCKNDCVRGNAYIDVDWRQMILNRLDDVALEKAP